MKIKSRRSDEHPQRLNIIPLIDVVFMLMAFLLMTFKIGSPEGDFEMTLTHAGAGKMVVEPSVDMALEPVRIRMSADAEGNLAGIIIGDYELGPDTILLRNRVAAMMKNVASDKRKQWCAEIEFDRLLRYQYTMDAISAVRGHFVDKNFVPLIEKVNIREIR